MPHRSLLSLSSIQHTFSKPMLCAKYFDRPWVYTFEWNIIYFSFKELTA